jgi:hypothetical protein
MYKRKPIKVISFLLALCLLLTVFSGSSVQTNAAELEQRTAASSVLREFYFRHFYDPETFNLHRHYIVSAAAFVDRVYSSEFSVTFPSTGMISADNITEINDCSMDEITPCLSAYCGPNSTHHKDVARIARQMLLWKEQNITGETVKDNYIVTLWTDREYGTYCYYHIPNSSNSYVHEYLGAFACVLNHQPFIHILNIADETTEQRIPHMSIILAHELAHCFGAEDIYGQGRHPAHQDDQNWQCLVDIVYTVNDAAVNFYTAVQNGAAEPFCVQCQSAIRTGLLYWPNVG